MLVEGAEDFDTAMGLVNAIWMAPLSEFTPGQHPPARGPVIAKPIDPLDSLDFFRVMNEKLKTLPRRPGEQALMAQFDAINVGPGSNFDIAGLSEAGRRGLERAVADGREIVDAATRRTIQDYNGWMISKDIGRYGFDYMHRASVARGGYGNLPEESLYPAMVFDGRGNLLDGARHYTLNFEPGQLPPVNGFWSLAAYRLSDLQLEENAIGRYSIGDRTRGLRYNADGSLTLHLQHEQPEDEQANWLPVPTGYFMLVMRLYEPSAAALSNDYLLPRVKLTD
jgi:hypothetical protein